MSDRWVITEGERNDKIVVRWTAQYALKSLEYLGESIESFYGIERVYMHKYSCEVFFATHLHSKESCAKLLTQQLMKHFTSIMYWQDKHIELVY